MQITRGLVNLRPSSRGLALTIGNFDGVHLGHRAILDRLRERARSLDVPTAVVTFEPNPREYFDPAHAPARLMRLRDKAAALAAAGVDRLVLLRFDERLRALSADEFAGQVLAGALAARHVVIGSGFRFGRGRSGTVEILADHGRRLGFGVEAVEPVMQDGERVSSTRVRAALAAGDLPAVRRLLGRDFSISGRVIDGRKLGRSLGYPTANMRLHRRVTPLFGIFAVRVRGIGEGARPGVASLGTRPTVGGGELLLETHLFDFEGDLYGRYLEVEFVARLRDEIKFPDIESLIARMHVDAAEARRLLAAG
jgi:riboflavin kinase / FMN adenylyltransferase